MNLMCLFSKRFGILSLIQAIWHPEYLKPDRWPEPWQSRLVYKKYILIYMPKYFLFLIRSTFWGGEALLLSAPSFYSYYYDLLVPSSYTYLVTYYLLKWYTTHHPMITRWFTVQVAPRLCAFNMCTTMYTCIALYTWKWPGSVIKRSLKCH